MSIKSEPVYECDLCGSSVQSDQIPEGWFEARNHDISVLEERHVCAGCLDTIKAWLMDYSAPVADIYPSRGPNILQPWDARGRGDRIG